MKVKSAKNKKPRRKRVESVPIAFFHIKRMPGGELYHCWHCREGKVRPHYVGVQGRCTTCHWCGGKGKVFQPHKPQAPKRIGP